MKNENIQKRYNDAQVLIFGNSHTFYGLNPNYFVKPTFNISNVSQSLFFDNLLFEKHINKFQQLKYVVLNVEYTSLSFLNGSDEDRWRKYYYQQYMNLNVPFVSYLDVENYFLSTTRNFNFNCKLIKRCFFEKTLADCNTAGFGINYNSSVHLKSIKEEALITVKKHEDYRFDFSENLNILKTIIKRCQSRGIKVILVTMPVTRYYACGVNQKKLNEIFRSCNKLDQEFQNMNYLNLFTDNRFSLRDFHDPDHLNTNGAEKCSKILNDFIVKIGI